MMSGEKRKSRERRRTGFVKEDVSTPPSFYQCNSERSLVEAVGIEPTSETTRLEKNYVRFRFSNLGWPL